MESVELHFVQSGGKILGLERRWLWVRFVCPSLNLVNFKKSIRDVFFMVDFVALSWQIAL